MSFFDEQFIFQNYNFSVDTPWQASQSDNLAPFVPPKGNMVYLDATSMQFLNGDQMVYLET